MILLIDNYDSFVHNLARYLRRLGQHAVVLRNDAVTVSDIARLRPEAIVLSPGPCTPMTAGCSLEVIRQFHTTIPLLGICLGHQAIAMALGGEIIRAAEPVHGRLSEVFHDGRGVFAGSRSPLAACRYHSLMVDEDSLPDCLEVSARTADGVVMAMRHVSYPVVGLQFHPESILTTCGFALLGRFLDRVGIPVSEPRPIIQDEWGGEEAGDDSRRNRDDAESGRHTQYLAHGTVG